MAILLALLSAVAYGAGDFLGGLASRRATTIGAVTVSQASGLVMLVVILALLPEARLGRADALWGAAAGLAGGVGVALLYHALAIGPMSTVAPVTAVCAVALPVAAGLAFGERLTAMTSAGILLAIVAIVLVGQETREPAGAGLGPPDRAPARGLRLAIASGLAIGLFLIALERASTEAGLWPLAVARGVSVAFFLSLGTATRQRVTVPRGVLAMAIAGGGLDMAANALYVVAVGQGQLSVVSTLVSLYPASTVILARFVLRERLSPLQLAGMISAFLATGLIVGGIS